METPNWWISSGLAAEAAKELWWFVTAIFVGIGIAIWRSDK